jgi:hypothetical protein
VRVVVLGLFEVLKSHTDQAAVIEAVRRCLSLMLQLMGAGNLLSSVSMLKLLMMPADLACATLEQSACLVQSALTGAPSVQVVWRSVRLASAACMQLRGGAGAQHDKEGTCRLLKLALKAAMTPHSWQASNMTLQAKHRPLGLSKQRRGTLTHSHRQCMHLQACSNAIKSGQAGSLCS